MLWHSLVQLNPASLYESNVPHVFDLLFEQFLEMDWDGVFPLGDRRYVILHLDGDQIHVSMSHTFENFTVLVVILAILV